MNIQRVVDPKISVYLLPWYVEGNQTRIEIGLELNDRLEKYPDTTCVLTAEKDGYLKAVLIGYIENDYLFIWQANKSKDMDRPRLMFHKLCQWAKEKGIKKAQLNAPDKRVRRMYRRKYGFTQSEGSLMEKQL